MKSLYDGYIALNQKCIASSLRKTKYCKMHHFALLHSPKKVHRLGLIYILFKICVTSPRNAISLHMFLLTQFRILSAHAMDCYVQATLTDEKPSTSVGCSGSCFKVSTGKGYNDLIVLTSDHQT